MSNEQIRSWFVTEDNTIRETIETIDRVGKGIALVIDNDERLLGVVTDGDIRRTILKGVVLGKPVKEIMNSSFTFVTKGYSSILVENLFRVKRIRHIPVLDNNMRVIDVIFHNDVINKPVKNNYALIMAGGMGVRLRPLTHDTPKPMLKVGARPILETIIEQLKSYGYLNILLSVNYKADIIENYFQDGTNFGVNISYIKEEEPLGTGGPIKLAQKYLDKPFFVINGDLLTKLSFENFMEYHLKNENQITIGTRKYDLQIPYGVVELKEEKVVNLYEKPVNSYFVNGGIYCLNQEVIDYIPSGQFYNITDLIENILRNKGLVGSFPIREYWMDIGQMNDYQQANNDYEELFGSEISGIKE